MVITGQECTVCQCCGRCDGMQWKEKPATLITVIQQPWPQTWLLTSTPTVTKTLVVSFKYIFILEVPFFLMLCAWFAAIIISQSSRLIFTSVLSHPDTGTHFPTAVPFLRLTSSLLPLSVLETLPDRVCPRQRSYVPGTQTQGGCWLPR